MWGLFIALTNTARDSGTCLLDGVTYSDFVKFCQKYTSVQIPSAYNSSAWRDPDVQVLQHSTPSLKQVVCPVLQPCCPETFPEPWSPQD